MYRLNESTPASMEELQLIFEKRKQFGDYLVEKWCRTEPGKRLDETYSRNPEKARNIAILLENQARHLKYLKESGVNISQYFLTTPQNVLKIVRLGVANSNRDKIFTEYPLLTMHDAIYFIFKEHADSLRGANAGDFIFEMTPNEWRYPTEIEVDTLPLSGGPGPIDGRIASIASTSQVPITVGSIRIVAVGPGNQRMYIGYDGGDGRIYDIFSNNIYQQTASPLLIDPSNSTVNYSTGAITITFDANATANLIGSGLPNASDLAGFFSNILSIEVQYNFDTELNTNFNQIGSVKISVKSLRFRPRPYPISYSFTHMARLTLETTKLGDIEDMLIKAVGEEHAMRRDYQAFVYARQLANSNRTYTFDADFAGANEDNDFNHAQRFLTAINAVSGDIYNELKRGEINKIITTPIGKSYLAKLIRFEPDKSQPRVGPSYLAGRIDGIEIYVTPASPNTVNDVDIGSGRYNSDMLLIYKNPTNEGEPSIAFGVLTELAATLDYPELYRKSVIASIEDQIVVQRRFIRRMTITNIGAFGQ